MRQTLVVGGKDEMTEIRVISPDTSDGISTVVERPTHLHSLDHRAQATANQPRRPALRDWGRRTLSDWGAESPPLTPEPGVPLLPPRLFRETASGATSRSVSPFHHASSPYRSQETLRSLFPDASSNIFSREWVKDGSIAQLHSRDDKEFLTGWKRHLYYLTPLLALTTLALYWLYFGLRITFVISAMNKYHSVFPLAWIFIGIEISVAIPTFMQTSWSIFIYKKRTRPKLRLVGNDAPTVDVFITCCGEDDDLVLDTARAACDLDYPQDSFRVLVLDDGKSDALKKAVEDLSEIWPNVLYVRRPKYPGVPHHFKAGNLNYALDYVHTLPGGAGQFMAALDADMIPEQCWLRAVVPHMLVDPKMALACPPQLFYNIPPGDPLCQSLDFFVHVSEPVKDALGVAWCTGSGYVVRREALDEIGNFPQGSLAEDVATSTLLLGKGWKTAFVHEALQFGTVPEDYGSHLKQRTRWAIGTVDTSFKLNFCLWGSNIKQLTAFQRMSSFIYAVLSLFNIFLCLSLFAMPIVLILNKPLVAYSNANQLRWLIRACFASVVSNRLCEFVMYLPSGYHTGQRGSRSQIWMAPYISLTIIRAFVLPTWLGGVTQAFKPTGSLKSDLQERDAKARAPMWRRMKVITINYLAGFHVSYVYFVLTAVALSTYRCFLKHTVRAKLECLLTHAFWPPLAWVIVISAFWIPITYACDPPTMPDRESLLVRDPKTGIAHPTKASKKTAFNPQTALFELEYCITTAFTAFIFVAAFFF